MFKFSPLLFAAVLLLPHACSAHSSVQTLSPATAANLRRLLPLPEETLRRKLELDIGLDYQPHGTSALFRPSSDYAARVVQVRRTLTGSVADAPRYCHLGFLYRDAGLSRKSRAAFRQSEMLCRSVLMRQPENTFALVEYGRTLAATGRTAEAEESVKKAARIAPNCPGIWLALGTILAGQVSPKTEAAMHFARDAGAAYDRAILCAPRDPAAWVARGGFLDWVLPSLHGKMLGRDGLSDYEEAAALAPDDPYAQAMVPTIDYGFVEFTNNLPTSPEAAGKETPDAVRRAKEALRRITAIALTTSGKRSAAAYTARAWVQFQFCYDPHGAQKSLRLALQQSPQEQDAIDYQMHVAAVTGDYVLLAAACRRQLRHRAELRLCVLLAYADYYLAQHEPAYWQEGLAQMETAHSTEPRDYAVSLDLAVLLLASGQTGQAVRADLLLRAIAPQVPPRPKAQRAEYDVTRGIGSALSGDLEDSRRFLRLAIQNAPNNQPAKSALALLSTRPQPRWSCARMPQLTAAATSTAIPPASQVLRVAGACRRERISR